MTTVHKVAQAGFAEKTAMYDAYRPKYPESQIAYIQSALSNPTEPLNVLELGAGTGIFTRCLLAHESFGRAVGRLDAVEPSAGMRTTFSETVDDARVTCREGTFDNTGADNSWADVIVVAQAWHWCPDHEKALTEFARVLKPNGVVAFIWNLEDSDVPWVAKNREIYERYEQGSPQFRLGLWRKMFEVPAIKLFKSHEEKEITWSFPTDLSRVIERVFTKSYINVLPDDEKEKVRAELTENTNHGEGRKWIDEKEGIWEYPYKNLVVILKK